MAENLNLKMERNFARDAHAFRCPTKRQDAEKDMRRLVQDHQKQLILEAAWWRWQGDKREFLIPREFIPFLPKIHLVRDVLAAVTTLWYQQRPEDRKIYTTLREIARLAGIPVNQENLREIQTALAFLRAFTIVNQEVITKLDKAGRKKETTMLTYGFISYVGVEGMRDGKEVPPNKKRTIICITEPYATLLNLLPPATIPTWWLDAAKKLPRRQVAHAKNLVYRLAAERRNPAEWKESTVEEILDLRSPRTIERRRAIRRILDGLAAAGVLEYQIRGGIDGKPVYVLRTKRGM
ncbi:hypothetical protein [Thermodesulfitimonas autotrophica]|nr:hypothetical protein [Thermodesulfitimonas autotrophica]